MVRYVLNTLECYLYFYLQTAVTTPVLEPNYGDPFWQDREVVAVLVHTLGHWISYIPENQIWWQVDSAGGGNVIWANPFDNQTPHHLINVLAFM